MKKLSLTLLLTLFFVSSYGQGDMPPSILVPFDQQKISKSILKQQFNFVLQHFSGTVKRYKISEKPLRFESQSFDFIDENGININLELQTDKHGHIYPKKGDLIGFYLQDKKSGKYMRIFIRICKDLYVRAVLPLKGLEFEEGNYFFDMCSSEPEYQIIFRKLCPEHFKTGETVFDPFLYVGKSESHKVRISKLNRILKKYDCHE